MGQHAAPARENTSEWVQAKEARDKYGDDLEAMVEFGTLEARESTMLPKGSGKLEYKVRDSGGQSPTCQGAWAGVRVGAWASAPRIVDARALGCPMRRDLTGCPGSPR